MQFYLDGSELLFDENHQTIWIKRPDGTVECRGDPPDRLMFEERFWDTGLTQPEYSKKTRKKIDRVLRVWGLL
jgi:hypothetical protein